MSFTMNFPYHGNPGFSSPGIKPLNHSSVPMHSTPLSLSSSASHSVHSSSSLPWYYYYGAKPLLAGGVGFVASSILYPGAAFSYNGSTYSRGLFVAGALAIGMVLSELFHDKVYSHVPKAAKTLMSEATAIGITALVDYSAHILVSPEIAQDLSKTKVLMEAAGVVIITDYVFEHFFLPMFVTR